MKGLRRHARPARARRGSSRLLDGALAQHYYLTETLSVSDEQPVSVRKAKPMNNIKWRIAGDEVVSCNCAWDCPCQFNALPTSGRCEGVAAFEVHEGNFGDAGSTACALPGSTPGLTRSRKVTAPG